MIALEFVVTEQCVLENEKKKIELSSFNATF